MAFCSEFMEISPAASLTMGAEKTAPPGDGSRAIMAGMAAMTTRRSEIAAVREETIRLSIPVVRRIFSITMVSMRVRVITMDLEEKTPMAVALRKSRGGVRYMTPR